MKETVEMIVSFGDKVDYLFKDIRINEKYGYPILLENKIIGGIRIRNSLLKGWRWCEIMGIEIIPEFRMMGLATSIIKEAILESDVVSGAIVDDCVGFWLSLGAVIYEIPIENFPKDIKDDIKIDKPLTFYITANKDISDYFDDVHKKMKQLCK
jgi:hypothetical protein